MLQKMGDTVMGILEHFETESVDRLDVRQTCYEGVVSANELRQVNMPTLPVKKALDDPKILEKNALGRQSNHVLSRINIHRPVAFLVGETPSPKSFMLEFDGFPIPPPIGQSKEEDQSNCTVREGAASASMVDAVQRTRLTANAAPQTQSIVKPLMSSPFIHPLAITTSTSPKANLGGHEISQSSFMQTQELLLPVAVGNQLFLQPGMPTDCALTSYAVSTTGLPQFAYYPAAQYAAFSYNPAPQIQSTNYSIYSEIASEQVELSVNVSRDSITPSSGGEGGLDKNQQVPQASGTLNSADSYSVRQLRRGRRRLETNDPVKAAQRHRNGLAAAKYRIRRQSQHKALEETNLELRTRFTKELEELRQTTQTAVEDLKLQIQLLRQCVLQQSNPIFATSQPYHSL